MKFKKAINYIHLWLGLTSGLVIFIVAITGAIYVFSEDIINIYESDFRYVDKEQKSKLTPNKLKAIADKEIDAFFGKKEINYWDWQSLYYYNNSERAVVVEGHRYKNPDVYHQVYINPYTGKVLKVRNTWASKFWDVIIELHTSLMLGDVGVYIVEFGTLIFLLMIISGMILWWPKNKHASKQRFFFKWKENVRWRRKNYDLHSILGFYMCWIVIFMVITGLFWSFDWFKNSVYYALDGEIPVVNELKIDSLNPIQNNYNTTDLMLIKARTLYPNADSYSLNYPKKNGMPFEILVKESKNWAPNHTLYFNPENGSLIFQKKYESLSTGQKFNELTGDIHYGWIFGWPSKILTFFGCLIAASLPFTGFYIWYGRRKKFIKKNMDESSVPFIGSES